VCVTWHRRQVLNPELVFDGASLERDKGKAKGGKAAAAREAAAAAAAVPAAAAAGARAKEKEAAPPPAKKARGADGKPAAAAAAAAPKGKAARAAAAAARSAAAADPAAAAAAAPPAAKPKAKPKPAADAAAAAADATPSKTRRRRELRKKQLAAAAAIIAAGGVAAPAAAATPSRRADDAEDNADDSDDDDVAPVGTLKPPSSKKRKRAAAAAAVAAAAPPAPELADVSAWAPFGLHPDLLLGLSHLGFATPTRVQAECLPAALREGRDVIGAAATGSGKTLAFGLPILHALARRRSAAASAATAAAMAAGAPLPAPPRSRLRALVLCPTRELALQVASHLSALGRFVGARVAPIVGGIAPAKQSRLLGRCPAIVVGTPGRLWELISEGAPQLARLHALSFLVLDEADRMVEKGHYAELAHILDAVETRRAEVAREGDDDSDADDDDDDADADADADGEGAAGAAAKAPRRRQTFVFSATLTVPSALRKRLRLKPSVSSGGAKASRPGAVSALLEAVPFTGTPRVVDVTDAARVLAPRLEEAVLEGSDAERDGALTYLLTRHAGRAIVFCNAISCVRRVAALLATLKLPACALHAAQQQRQRLASLDRFKGHPNGCLVATDVAARGLDIPGVRTVIHYQVPPSVELYVHRSGRTARAQADGLAVMLVTPGERSRYAQLCKALGQPTGLPPFPVEPGAMAAARRRAAVAVKLDGAKHSREKRKGDAAWRRKSAAELDLALDEDEEDAARGRTRAEDEEEGRPGKGRGVEAPSARERDLQRQLDALLATPLAGARLGTAHATGSRRFPTFAPGAAAAQRVGGGGAAGGAAGSKRRGGGGAGAVAAAATEGQDALSAVMAKRAALGAKRKRAPAHDAAEA
jgi:ATP-dependent RNA helicase DDX24/MAK5